ncbi:MAG: cytochrome C [Pseudomonadota bacterium]
MTLRKLTASATLVTLFALPAMAADATGDAAAGEEAFSQCISCHVVVNGAGETLAGRNARTGPNLYGVPGAAIGRVEDFRYGDGIVEANEQGLMWTEENFVAYVQDPTGWLREATENKRARGKMSYRVRDEADAINLYAYLFSLTDGGS